MPKAVNNRSKNWRDWSARKLSEKYEKLPATTRAEIDAQMKEWAAQARKIAEDTERPFRLVCKDYDRKNPRSRAKFYTMLAHFANVRADEIGDMPMIDVLGMADAVVELRPTMADASSRSPAMSKAELARRITNNSKARPRDVNWARFDMMQESDRRVTVSLENMDEVMRERVLKPIE
jgi:hypothetical protein